MKQIGIIGLGKMGTNLIQNIQNQGYEPVGFDVNQAALNFVQSKGINVVNSVEQLVNHLEKPRHVMLSIPAGKIIHVQIQQLLTLLEPGDVIIDASNSYYEETIKHSQQATEKGLEFVDVGISGGVSGALDGACLMVGGNDHIIASLTPFFTKLAVKDGFYHTGKPGSGHYAKMVHNGIEYGMMQAIAEGFEIIKNAPFDFDQEQLAKVWNHGSVIRSWLMELTQNALHKDPNLQKITGYVEMNGEGTWTVMEAMKLGIPTPVISLSVQMRERSWQKDSYAGKVLASLRNEFGGHQVVQVIDENLEQSSEIDQ